MKNTFYKTVVCVDGAELSVQASEGHYCSPRDDFGPYSAVEVDFPSVRPHESMMQYAENPEDPTGTVYGWVPFAEVFKFINAHGGMRKGELPPANGVLTVSME